MVIVLAMFRVAGGSWTPVVEVVIVEFKMVVVGVW